MGFWLDIALPAGKQLIALMCIKTPNVSRWFESLTDPAVHTARHELKLLKKNAKYSDYILPALEPPQKDSLSEWETVHLKSLTRLRIKRTQALSQCQQAFGDKDRMPHDTLRIQLVKILADCSVNFD